MEYWSNVKIIGYILNLSYVWLFFVFCNLKVYCILVDGDMLGMRYVRNGGDGIRLWINLLLFCRVWGGN